MSDLEHALPPHSEHASFSFSLSTLLLATTLIAIGTGLVVAAPGLGVPFCILLAPVLLRTSLVVRRRKELGHDVSLGEKAALVSVSLVVAAVIATVVAVASVGTFCGICLGLYSVSGDTGLQAGFIISPIATIVAVYFAAKFSTRWIRRRYRHDTELPAEEPTPHPSMPFDDPADSNDDARQTP